MIAPCHTYYFPEADIAPESLQRTEHTTRYQALGLTSWYTVHAGEQSTARAAWQHVELPAYASEPGPGRVRVAGTAMSEPTATR